jgi:hypothetical protein
MAPIFGEILRQTINECILSNYIRKQLDSKQLGRTKFSLIPKIPYRLCSINMA